MYVLITLVGLGLRFGIVAAGAWLAVKSGGSWPWALVPLVALVAAEIAASTRRQKLIAKYPDVGKMDAPSTPSLAESLLEIWFHAATGLWAASFIPAVDAALARHGSPALTVTIAAFIGGVVAAHLEFKHLGTLAERRRLAYGIRRNIRSGFRDASLIGASFAGSNASRTDFTNAVLRDAKFDGTDLRAAIFCGADLDGASFIGADLCAADLRGAIGKPQSFVGCNVSDTTLVDNKMVGLVLPVVARFGIQAARNSLIGIAAAAALALAAAHSVI